MESFVAKMLLMVILESRTGLAQLMGQVCMALKSAPISIARSRHASALRLVTT